MDALADARLDLPAWQAILDREAAAFAALASGACVGFVPRRVAGPDGSLRSTAMPSVAPPLAMLAWARDAGGTRACVRSYRGLADAACDVLFFCEPDALEAVLARADEPLGELKRRIRAGRILLMVLRTRQELRARGYEDFLESLGLPFMGACR